ncbi:NarL family two-component system sensor histidine kinase LiaS [Salirhabdus euzebyi]|uniref:Oxygen sensor histidine kinase NreB n=1 Tax=Salirhabdus euzebyi TaxID=394506 RepID=A0A841Q8G7_9BACI|nr:sensor histidine kinase [Salirhabdus euzebyi]MBB6454685.1 NarL family two-component system sensor histidine kinase LiaS [Salirhabdus euzebyi]
MFSNLNSLRFRFVRAQFQTIYFSLLVIAFILFFMYSVFSPSWLTLRSIFLTILLISLIMTPVCIYVSFHFASQLKERIDGISILISQLSKGRYSSRIYDKEYGDEIGHITTELNNLADKMQNQVKSLQRMADEKNDYAKEAYKVATMEERQRLARDLHDAVSQQLFALTMMSQATLRLLDKDPEKAKKQMEEIAHMALQAQTEMRALLLHLRPVHLSGESLQSGLYNLIEELKQRCQIDFTLHIEEIKDISSASEEHLFRMIQEILSNILRHANSSEVTIELKEKTDEIYLYIRDNGDGFDVSEKLESKTSYGLKTIKERTEELGGSFVLRSKKGEGTYIIIRIPL